MSWVKTYTLIDRAKNCAVKITGVPPLPEMGWVTVVELSRFNPVPSRLKIEHIEWAITGRIEVLLAWHAASGERELLFPLASRGYMNFSDYDGGLTNQLEGRSGHIELCTQDADSMKKGIQCFTIFLDFIRQQG